jgi:hypothetical protein
MGFKKIRLNNDQGLLTIEMVAIAAAAKKLNSLLLFLLTIISKSLKNYLFKNLISYYLLFRIFISRYLKETILLLFRIFVFYKPLLLSLLYFPCAF